ncbi:hypothetical protein C6497_02095 [Candidatus Poribacteria bacterium]|nr:MAG: hypothetical protein C6497_02095 [Candidatus Poribacteria bacterium]
MKSYNLYNNSIHFLIIACGFITLFLIPNIINAVPNPPMDLQGWVLDTLAKLEVSGITKGFHRHSLPLSRYDIAKIIDQSQMKINSGEVTLTQIDRKLLEKLKREFSSELSHINRINKGSTTIHKSDLRIDGQIRGTDESIAPGLQTGFYYTVGNKNNKLNVYSELEVSNFKQTQDFVDSFFLPKPPPLLKSADQRYERWHADYVVDFKRSYIQYIVSAFEKTEFDLLVGRDYIYWGASPFQSVLISDNSPPFELIRLTGTIPCVIGTLKATSFTSQLNSTWYDDGTNRYLAKRYLSAHRLDYHFKDWLELGISESVLYGGDAQTVDWHYLNPIIPYYAVQYNAVKDDNLMLGFDGSVKPIVGLRLYAEWLADDFQYQSDSNDPHAVSWLTGFEWYPRLLKRQLGINSEYVRVNRWAYTHLIPDNEFTHFGTMIGHPIGTDADIFTFSISYDLTSSARLITRFNHQRNGEADITDRFFGEEYLNIPFPSGVVEKLSELRIGWKYRPNSTIYGSIDYSWRNIQNAEHLKNKVKQQHRIVLMIAYVWRN